MYNNNNTNFGFSGGRHPIPISSPTTPFSPPPVITAANLTFDTKDIETFTYAYLRVAKANFQDSQEDSNRNNENVTITRNRTSLDGNYLFTKSKYILTTDNAKGLFRPEPTFTGDLDDLPRGQKGRYRFKYAPGKNVTDLGGIRSILSTSDFTINSEIGFGEYIHYDPQAGTGGSLPLDFSPARVITDITRSRLTVPVLYSRYG